MVLFNHSEDDFQVKQGDRIAQLILEKIQTPPVKETADLPSTVRGQKRIWPARDLTMKRRNKKTHQESQFCSEFRGSPR